jgi:hypothetical protein
MASDARRMCGDGPIVFAQWNDSVGVPEIASMCLARGSGRSGRPLRRMDSSDNGCVECPGNFGYHVFRTFVESKKVRQGTHADRFSH